MMTEFSSEPLTPVAFLQRAGAVFADRVAVIDGAKRFTYAQFFERAQRLAGALARLGVEPGERVALLAPNTHVLLESHFGVPFAGAVLVALNARLAAPELAYILQHSGAKVLIYDEEFDPVVRNALQLVPAAVRLIRAGSDCEEDEYEDFIQNAPCLIRQVVDERSLLALNYTSGTTGKPKGVMYHHRGAYLQALAMALHTKLDSASVFLWTLPMFHCNGWCFPWALTAAGATHLCLRRVEPGAIWQHLRHSGVTHLNAAPTVLAMLAWDAGAASGKPPQRVRIATGGSPPTPALLARLEELSIEVTHLYGLTETFGPSIICDWRAEWSLLPLEEQARLKARQGVANVISQPVRIVATDGSDVPADGQTMGEIHLRGNNLMLGYYRDEEATQKACATGWFRTGDLGVMHPGGYIELKDRSKDIIISGGENISSVEIEQALALHPAVLESAVVAAPDEKWGEVPVAFVALKGGAQVDSEKLIEYLRSVLSRYKVPKRIVFGDLPKTATGKIQKFVLRARALAA